MTTAEQRYDVRVPLQRMSTENFVASIEAQGARDEAAVLENLSAGGVLVRTQRLIQTGEVVSCKVEDRMSGQGIVFQAEARWSKSIQSPTHSYQIGLSVRDFQRGTREMWEELRLSCLDQVEASDLVDPHIQPVTDSALAHLPVIGSQSKLSEIWQSLLDSPTGLTLVKQKQQIVGLISLRACARLFTEQQLLLSFRHNRSTELEKAVAAHELRGPMGLIKSTLGLISTGGVDLKELTEAGLLESMLIKCDQGLEIIDRYLGQARSRGQSANPKVINLARLVGEVVAEFRSMSLQKHIRIEFDESTVPAPIFAVELEIFQIVRNLITNAIKYSNPNSNVCVELMCHSLETHLRIADQGIGIATEQLANLFSPFGICGNQTTNGESQSGLGLYLTKQLVENNRGKIQIQSQHGKGTTAELFFLTHSVG